MNKEIIYQIYNEIKNKIEERISVFNNIWNNGTEEEIFFELVFCLLTPQSKARMASIAVNRIKEKNLLYKNDVNILSNELNIVRFKNNKAKYIIDARNYFTLKDGISIKQFININNIKTTRNWFAENIKGIGYKEASHFLRNIGHGMDLAILDRHILKNLALLNVIDNVPKTISPKIYFEIENKLIKFSKTIDIPSDYLDFILWFKETDDIFK